MQSWVRVRTILKVLNALRHQRMVQIRIFLSGNFGAFVLNALRHQRMVQVEMAKRIREGRRCSTPYGIRGWCSNAELDTRGPSCDVLNALRHQRMVQHLNGRTRRRPANVLNALRHQRMVQSPCPSQISKEPEIMHLNLIQTLHVPFFLWHRRHPEMLESCTSARRVH